MMTQEPDTFRAQGAASRLIREYGITDPGQIALEDIAWDRGIYVRAGSIEGAEAWLLRRGRRGLIRVSNRIAEMGRRRFATGHELGHWELHLDLSQAWLCTSDDIHAYRGGKAEIEANAFSAALLMPQEMFRPRVTGRDLGFDLVRILATEFQTTLTATAIRVVEETDQDCYVVLSRGGRINWWKRSARGSGLYLDRHQPIDPDSLAWRCEYEQVEHCRMAQVPVHAWFQSGNSSEVLELWEESLLLFEYQVVLTLLCVV